LYQQQLQHQ